MAEIDVIEATVYRTHATTASLVTARKHHLCAFERDASWGRACSGRIRPGEQYVRIVVFPGHDIIDVPSPRSDACCLTCARGYIGIDSIVPADTPPTARDEGGDQ